MAQPLRPYQPSAAETTLQMSTAGRGMGGMNRELAQPGPNMGDGGSFDKLPVNPQGQMNAQFLQGQNLRANEDTAMYQRGSDAIRGMDKAITERSGAEHKAAEDLARYKAEILVGTGGGVASMKLDAERKAGNLPGIIRDVQAEKARAFGMNPDLGDYSGQVMSL